MNYSDYRVRKYWGEAELIEYFYNLGFWDSLITMIGTFPIFMNYTDGLVGDSPQLPIHIAALVNYPTLKGLGVRCIGDLS
jgi:hypothetical protein